MTAFNLRTTPLARNALLAACAVITLGATAAHADFVSTGASGYWTAGQGIATDRAASTCMITSISPGTGSSVGIVTSSDDQRLRVVALKQGWNIPTGTVTSMNLQVDSNPIWQAPNVAVGGKTMVSVGINPVGARQFVHEVTSGSILHLYFSGSEQPWALSLSGTTGVWPQFMNCAQMVAPAVIASLTSTQPFVAAGPTQPFVAAPVRPPVQPSQPFNRI